MLFLMFCIIIEGLCNLYLYNFVCDSVRVLCFYKCVCVSLFMGGGSYVSILW